MMRVEQLERLRLQTRLFDAAEQAVVATDLAGEIFYWNRSAEKLYGWAAGEVIGRVATDFLVPEDQHEIAWKIMSRLRSGNGWSGELTLRHRSGKPVLVTTTNTPVYDDDGMLVGVVGLTTDVTERGRMEEALRDSEERFRVLSQSAFEGIFIHDGERILEANRALSDISGYEREELVGRPDLSFLTAESAELVRRQISSGSEEPVEVVGKRKDGSLIHLEVRGRGMTYRGSPARMVAVRDISRRKRAEADLAESETRYRALVEQVPVTTYTEVVSDSGSTQYISPQSETLLGYTPREIEELSRDGPFWGLLHPEDRDRAVAEDDRTNQTGQEFAAEYRMIRKDGRVVWVEDRAILVSRDENGVQRWQGVMQDVTARKKAERALRESEERFRSLVQNASDLITIMTAEGVILYESPAVEWVLGYEPEELVGQVAFDYVHPEDLDKVRGKYVEMLQNPEFKPVVEFRFRHRDGSWCHLEVICNNLLDDPTVNGVVVNSRDVTERKVVEDALREAEERYRTLVERLPAIVYVREAGGEGRPIYTSPQVEEILGYTVEECRLNRSPWLESLHPNDRERVLAEDRVSNETGKPFSMEYRQVSRDGRLVWMRDEAVLVRDGRGNPMFWQGFAMDITERKVLEEQLKYQAFHDPLTGLPNRALFADRLEHAIAGIERRGVGLAVLFLDLNDFKSVNDGFGHDTGDRLLVAVAERLRMCLRPLDTLARFGGDEFAILLEDVKTPDDVAVVANRISEEMRTPFHVEGRKLFTSVSIGISLGDSADALAEEMLRNADTAMYHAKARESVNYEVFEPRMYARILKRLELTTDLRRALEQGEFRVHYQPQVQLQTGRIVGMEALVRWEHPERGLIFPAEFIPLAEETGLIVPLGRWVLEEACRQAREWQSRHPAARDLRIGVNLSLNQFHNLSLVEEISGAVSEASLDPRHLSLEITENIAMKNAEITAAALQKLKGLGVHLAIDDFGTGHSSLAYLIRKFKMDVLKVDRSFVSELDHDVEDGTIVAGIVGLAQNLNLQVVAEGVETAEQYTRLRHIGCDLGQGFFFSRPLPGDQASRLLALDTRW